MRFKSLLTSFLKASLPLSLIYLAGCHPTKNSDGDSGLTPIHLESSANLSLFVDGAAQLTGSPNLYELNFSFPNHESPALHRRGDLPQTAGLISESTLPAGNGVVLTADLYRDQYDAATKTHMCRQRVGETVQLQRQQTASATLICYPMTGADSSEAAEVFIAVSTLNLDLQEGAASERLAERDWNRLALFSQVDPQGRRLSLRGNGASVVMNVGGEISFVATSEDPQAHLLSDLVNGAVLDVTPTAGRQIQAIQSSGQLRIDGQILLLSGSSTGIPRFIIPVRLTTQDGSINVKGNLVEEPAGNEFTVVAYNAENVFDQVDEDRNSTYGDYRIAPNATNMSSNYGQPVEFEGQTMTFTEVKLRGIRRVLKAIDPIGPEIVALEEIESPQVMTDLLALTQNMGYVAAEFSGWVPGELPNAIGTGILTKFPIKSRSLLAVPYPAGVEQRDEPIRPVFKVALNVNGKTLTVYINHWRSQAGPESLRKASAEVIQADIDTELAANAGFDYLIMGDLNSAYNESRVMEPALNDTNGTSGIVDVLKAQGDESLLLGPTPVKYNLHYELNAGDRKTHYDTKFGWACFDHMITGNGMYDLKGITYIDNSFTVPSLSNQRLSFLFEADGTTKRWKSSRQGNVTTHAVGGFSDHVPIFARFFISKQQNTNKIHLANPSRPDELDPRP